MTETEQIFGPSSGIGETQLNRDVEYASLGESYSHTTSIDQQEGESTTAMSNLASLVMGKFQENARFRRSSGVEDKLKYYITAQTCRFSESQREKLSKRFTPEIVDKIFAPITSTKNRAAKSMLVDLANQSGEPLFRIEASPDPDVPKYIQEEVEASVLNELTSIFSTLEQSGVQELPPEAMTLLNQLVAKATSRLYDTVENKEEQFAKSRAKRMEKKVWDKMAEGGFSKAFMKVLENVCVYGTGVMIGPFERTVACNKCVEDRKNKRVKYKRGYETRLCYESINPMDCYPAPDAEDTTDGPFCIRVKYVADELYRFCLGKNNSKNERKKEGWIPYVVNDILSRHPFGGVKINEEMFDPERRICERNGVEDTNDCTFEGIRCFMSTRGSVLASIGVVKDREGRTIELDRYYNTETIVIDNRVVFCRIYPDELSTPISKCSFYSLPGSWWGEAIADKVAMCQMVLNNTISALLSNMSASSLPVWWVKDLSRLSNKGLAATKIKAGMTLPFNSSSMPGGDSGVPLGAISIPSTANELIGIWRQFQTQADLDSGLPAYTEGQSAGQSGALRTASGLAVFTEASNRGLKMVMTSIDQTLISNVARMTADYILLYDDDMSLKGDVTIRSVGLIGKIMKAQRDQQRMQLLDMVQKSPILQQIAGIKGVVALFRPAVHDVDVNPDDVIPSIERMEELDLLQRIKQTLEATSASPQQPAEGMPQADPNGMQQGLQQQGVPDIGQANGPRPGSVAERRAIA